MGFLERLKKNMKVESSDSTQSSIEQQIIEQIHFLLADNNTSVHVDVNGVGDVIIVNKEMDTRIVILVEQYRIIRDFAPGIDNSSYSDIFIESLKNLCYKHVGNLFEKVLSEIQNNRLEKMQGVLGVSKELEIV